MEDAQRDVESTLPPSQQVPQQTPQQTLTTHQTDDQPTTVIEIVQASEHIDQPVLVRPLLPSSPQGVLSGSVDHLPTIYYVIVGRGPAAVINHSTLVQSAFGIGRLSELPLMHIGFDNPWPHYLQHGMGQPQRLLSLPGFPLPNQPTTGGLETHGGLDSRHFGAQVNAELQRISLLGGIEPRGPVSVKTGWVARIQAPGDTSAPQVGLYTPEEGGPELHVRLETACSEPHANFGQRDPQPYRLIVYIPTTGTIEFVYADYIDVCTGPGRPTVPPMRPETDAYTAARTPPWWSPEIWGSRRHEDRNLPGRKIFHGVDAIRDEVPWLNAERVCVSAGGGVGLNAAEKAHNHHARLDWFGRNSLRDTFINPRNKTFLWHEDEARRMTAADPIPDPLPDPEDPNAPKPDNDSYLLPIAGHLRYGKGASITAATLVNTSVSITLTGNTAQIRDFWGPPHMGLLNNAWQISADYTEQNGGLLASPRYDRLVIPAGQAAQGLGMAHSLLHHLGMVPLESGNRMICLNTNDGRVRVLGAAAQTYPGFALAPNSQLGQRGDTPQERMWDYRDQIPVSAVVDGFILSGTNIALANQAWGANQNVNTMTQQEIIAALRPTYGNDNAVVVGNLIVGARSAANGYANLDDLRLKAARNDIPDVFRYGY